MASQNDREKKMYVLHEYGANQHFIALEHFAKSNNYTVDYFEFSFFRLLFKSIVNLKLDLFLKQIKNFRFLMLALFSKENIIILGIAPFDWRILFLKYILRNHKVFYITSWPYWNKTKHPKQLLNNNYVHHAWKVFLESFVMGIFGVTQTSVDGLRENYKLSCPTEVVGHSINEKSEHSYNTVVSHKKGKLKIIYAGRLELSKGIIKVIEIAKKMDPNKYSFSIVGNGSQANKVKNISSQYNHITYYGFLSDKKKLFDLYKSHDVMLSLSLRTIFWEELFGISIIEAMYNGVVPIATNHPGPREIISHDINGFLLQESPNLESEVIKILTTNKKQIMMMKPNAINKGNSFLVGKLSSRWGALLGPIVK